MIRGIVPAIGLHLLLGGVAAAAPVELTVALSGGPSSSSATIRVRATDSSGFDAQRTDVTIPGRATFTLPEAALVTIEVTAPHAWAPVRTMYLGAKSTIDVALRRTGVVRGRVSTATPPLPKQLQLSWAADGDGSSRDAGRTVDCSVDGNGEWSCEVPEGRQDLRIGATGHVPLFVWNAVVDPGRAYEAGTRKLQRGSSVSGRVRAMNDTPLGKACRVTLTPRAAAASEEEQARRTTLVASSVTPDDRGFFQLAGVAPGDYELTVTHPEFATARLSPLTVLADMESALKAPVILRPRVALDLQVVPPVDPWKRPWHVRIETTTSGPAADTVGRSVLDGEGRHRFAGLPAGEHTAVVTTASGKVWHEQQVVLDGPQTTLRVQIPVVMIRGAVRLGDRPLAASLSFGAPSKSEHGIELTSGEDGKFEGMLPHKGDWRVDIVSEEHHVHRTLKKVAVAPAPDAEHAIVDLTLPSTIVSGRLVDEQGAPHAGWVSSRDRNTDVQVSTDPEGRFRIEGAMPGELVLSALASGQLASGEMTVTVPNDGELAPVVLVLRPRQWLEGRVISASGPVIGARVLSRPASRPFGTLFPVMTDAEGRFKLRIDERSDAVVLTVLAPGFTLEHRRFSTDLPLDITLSQAGGALELTSAASDDSPVPLLEYAGEYLPYGVLRGWAQMSGGTATDPRAFRVSQLPPGNYVVCAPRAGQTHADLLRGPRTAKQCTNGFLAPGGTLRLAVP